MYTWENELGVMKMKEGTILPSDLSPEDPLYFNQVRNKNHIIIIIISLSSSFLAIQIQLKLFHFQQCEVLS